MTFRASLVIETRRTPTDVSVFMDIGEVIVLKFAQVDTVTPVMDMACAVPATEDVGVRSTGWEMSPVDDAARTGLVKYVSTPQ